MYYTGTYCREELLTNVKIYSQLESQFKLFHHDSLVIYMYQLDNVEICYDKNTRNRIVTKRLQQ